MDSADPGYTGYIHYVTESRHSLNWTISYNICTRNTTCHYPKYPFPITRLYCVRHLFYFFTLCFSSSTPPYMLCKPPKHGTRYTTFIRNYYSDHDSLFILHSFGIICNNKYPHAQAWIQGRKTDRTEIHMHDNDEWWWSRISSKKKKKIRRSCFMNTLSIHCI